MVCFTFTCKVVKNIMKFDCTVLYVDFPLYLFLVYLPHRASGLSYYLPAFAAREGE